MSLLPTEIIEKLPENSVIRRVEEGKTENFVADCQTIANAKIDSKIENKKNEILENLRGG